MKTKIVIFLVALLFILNCGQSPNAEHPTPPTMVTEYYTYSTNDTVKTIKDTYGIDLVPEIGKSTSAVAQSGVYRVNKNGATDPVTNTTKDILDIAISTNKETTFTTSNTTTYTKDTTLQAVIP